MYSVVCCPRVVSACCSCDSAVFSTGWKPRVTCFCSAVVVLTARITFSLSSTWVLFGIQLWVPACRIAPPHVCVGGTPTLQRKPTACVGHGLSIWVRDVAKSTRRTHKNREQRYTVSKVCPPYPIRRVPPPRYTIVHLSWIECVSFCDWKLIFWGCWWSARLLLAHSKKHINWAWSNSIVALWVRVFRAQAFWCGPTGNYWANSKRS